MPPILSISSQIVAGRVGNSVAVPALQAIGVEVWPLPTVLLAETPGRRPVAGGAIGDEILGAMLERLAPRASELAAIHVGYLRTAGQVGLISKFIADAKGRNPSVLISVDPVMGDAPGGLYIPSETAEQIVQRIVPLADILFPNAWELERLVGLRIESARDVLFAANRLRCPRLACTSVPGRMGEIANVLAEDGIATIARAPCLPSAPHGTGDLFAALMLARLLESDEPGAALEYASLVLHDLIIAANEGGMDFLPVIERADLLRPREVIPSARIMAGDGSSPWVLGADGCRGGWVVVLARTHGAEPPRAMLCRDLSEILSLTEAPQVIALDVPIGLPEIAIKGGRAACNEARSRLGARQSSVFSVPARVALHAPTYSEACAVNLQNSVPPRKIAKQTFNILPRIAEVDALMTPQLQRRAFECHPELAFWAMNGERPLDQPKKMRGRPYAEGMALRRRLLAAAGFEVPRAPKPVQGVAFGEDDLIDACACAVTARRIASGEASRYPLDPPRDARGLRMEITA